MKKLSLFQAFGIELEYMVLDRETLRPASIAESVLLNADGETVQEINLGPIDVSNELATHVLEFKTATPTADFDQLQKDFHYAISEMNRKLARFNAVLVPSGIHPFMDPKTEGKTWSQGNRVIYETYNKIFDCHRHGWLNLQSCHLNLPFANEEEFARLHAAVILVLPYLPALSASSPYIEGKHDGFLDTRLNVYQSNQAKIPEIAGNIIPEPVFTYDDYQTQILQQSYKAIAPYDPDGILQEEWLNSRGAIARFERNAIEIRILDTQENPSQDLAICSLIIALLKTLCSLPMKQLESAAKTHTPLERRIQFIDAAKIGFKSKLQHRDLGELIELPEEISDLHGLWSFILEKHKNNPLVSPRVANLQLILDNGNLAQRLLDKNSENPNTAALTQSLKQLANNLSSYTPFLS